MFPDGIDNKIITLLLQDASLAYKDVAKKLGMNESTVRKRILVLREKQVIKRFSVEVDSALLGYKTRSILGVDVEPSKLLEVGGQLSRTPEVRSVSTTLGEHAFIIEVWAEDQDSLSKIVSNRLYKIDGVTRISPSIVVEKLK